MRALPVLVVALLLSSTVGATGGLAGVVSEPSPPAPAPESGPEPAALDAPVVAQTDENRTTLRQINVLDVPPESVDRSVVARHYVDLGPAVGLSTNATTHRLRTLAMVERVRRAETTDLRRERLLAALRDLETAVDELDRRQTAAVDAYSRGELTSQELLVTLVGISITAQELNDRRTQLEELSADTRGFDIDRGRLASIGNRLSAFIGPVRGHARAVLRGNADPHRFYVATGAGGVTISTIIGDTYVREAYRGDLRNGAGSAIELEVALDIVAESYPVIWNTTREQTQVFGGGETYPVRIGHSRGDLTAYVDSDARIVYAEHQRRPLETVVTDQRLERADGGLRLVVNHTYPGGPVQIRVVDEATDDPVEASVTIKAGPTPPEPVGTTGSDGTLWTLSPNRQYTVTVEARGTNVSTVVVPGVPPRVVGGGDGGDGNATATATPMDGAVADLYHP
ncbi:DUF7094 domain-containing protein [Haloplanus pelagicus]|jgi:hypothetical protein|uniref:DUF7094 domain-containing protein n=1 Tax=Haloplanus pelagicus TaxID=2949995 RepID=UPI00203DC88F|nr:hypothetical protein [Haloplanus sp. HW8-1]